MTITTPIFRRSSERQVTDPNETFVVEEDRRRNRELQAFEEIGFSQAAHSVLVEPLDPSDSWERVVDGMEAEDVSSYSLDGQVR